MMIPWALPTAVIALAWAWIFNDAFGVLNDLLGRLGLLSHPLAWLGEPATAFGAMVLADVWKTTSFAQVALVEPTGERVLLTLKVGGETLRAFAAAREWPGQVYVELPPERIHLFEAASGRRLP